VKKYFITLILLIFCVDCVSYQQDTEEIRQRQAQKEQEFEEKLRQADSWSEFRLSSFDLFISSQQEDRIHNKRRQWYIDTHSVRPQIANLIKQGNYIIGMTKDELRASIGFPNDINRTTSPYGISEQWVYKEGYILTYDIKCFYFEDDILTTIQD